MYNYYNPQASSARTYSYYDPQNTYGGSWNLGDWASTPVGGMQEEKAPQGVYARWLADNGFRDFTGAGEFARQQYGKMQTGYEAANLTNPDLTFKNYLAGQGQGLMDQYRRLTPEQRGENSNVFSPRARYIPR